MLQKNKKLKKELLNNNYNLYIKYCIKNNIPIRINKLKILNFKNGNDFKIKPNDNINIIKKGLMSIKKRKISIRKQIDSFKTNDFKRLGLIKKLSINSRQYNKLYTKIKTLSNLKIIYAHKKQKLNNNKFKKFNDRRKLQKDFLKKTLKTLNKNIKRNIIKPKTNINKTKIDKSLIFDKLNYLMIKHKNKF